MLPHLLSIFRGASLRHTCRLVGPRLGIPSCFRLPSGKLLALLRHASSKRHSSRLPFLFLRPVGAVQRVMLPGSAAGFGLEPVGSASLLFAGI